jgi:hypothetical protein
MLPLMKQTWSAGIALAMLAGVGNAGAGPDVAPPESGFAEFVESEIIPLMVETGDEAAASSEWPEIPPPVRPEDSAVETNAGATPAPGEPEAPPALRDPFWPAGYLPPSSSAPEERVAAMTNAEPVSAVALWNEALKAVSVQGIMKTGPDSYVAMVNGQVVGTNDVVSVRFVGREYRWQVAEVSERGVSFSRLEDEAPADDGAVPPSSP